MSSRFTYIVTLIVAAWTMVATAGVFSDFTARWLAFGSGAAIALLALIALTLHQTRRKRIVHALEPRANDREPVGYY
jgi:hypothetical protein